MGEQTSDAIHRHQTEHPTAREHELGHPGHIYYRFRHQDSSIELDRPLLISHKENEHHRCHRTSGYHTRHYAQAGRGASHVISPYLT